MTNDADGTVYQVTSADERTVAALAGVMAEAFNTRDDPMYAALYASVPDFDAFNLARCKGRVFDAISTKLTYAVDVGGRVAALATVFPPGVHSYVASRSGVGALTGVQKLTMAGLSPPRTRTLPRSMPGRHRTSLGCRIG